MSPADLIDDLRGRINPIYSTQVGTESYERRICAEAIETLMAQRDELLAALEFAQSKIAELHIEAGDGDCHYPIINDAIARAKGSAS